MQLKTGRPRKWKDKREKDREYKRRLRGFQGKPYQGVLTTSKEGEIPTRDDLLYRAWMEAATRWSDAKGRKEERRLWLLEEEAFWTYMAYGKSNARKDAVIESIADQFVQPSEPGVQYSTDVWKFDVDEDGHQYSGRDNLEALLKGAKAGAFGLGRRNKIFRVAPMEPTD